ncbi:hypothetical protein [Cryobacterium fucosi]|uniref:Uncharacterized protein n=1 Tax=Cryobacterium fucosi TaxID=1259157 RepID=A0A4R9B292_9MICO|nr:hypothetical protein [Cryobacterium fucosi]TFD74475.1 hypothetical protein E3T48_13395 [Cryobacterium fucosi]
MNENKIFQAPRASRSKRLTVGAASVLAAAALLGAGVQGASAAPLTATPEHTAGAGASASASASAEPASAGAVLSSIQKELRGDLSNGQDTNVKAQKVAATLVDHAELFASLPANLQADLTALKDASAADRAAAVQTIRNTALDGGYGEQIATVATAVQNDPTHPLAAALHGALGADTAAGADATPSVTKLALGVVDNPALFSKLPADLQSALTELKNAPAAEQDAAALVIQKAALNGDYGHDIRKVVKHILAGAESHSNAKAGADAGADTHADTESGGADTDAGADAKAGN